MEQSQYWMWMKRKHVLSSNIQSSMKTLSYCDSWEERAFAKDSSGVLGGCVWPPRSYSCSFCRREFRSAQALGGHMNVHRRDRARLKQSPSPHNEILDLDHHSDHHNNLQNPCTSFDDRVDQYPFSQISSLSYSPNPNPPDHCVLGSSFSPSRVSSEKLTLVPLLSSPTIQEQHKKTSLSSPQSWSKKGGDENISKLEYSWAKGDYVKADLSVSLNLVLCRKFPTESTTKEDAANCKRRKIETTLPLFLSSSSIEDLDLELRLGDRPKVK